MALTVSGTVTGLATVPAAAEVKSLAGVSNLAGATSQAKQSYIVRAVPGSLNAVADQVLAHGGTITTRLPALDSVTGRLSASAVAALRRNPRVAKVTADSSVAPMGLLDGLLTPVVDTLVTVVNSLLAPITGGWGSAPADYSPTSDANSLYSLETLTGVRGLWKSGYTGAGIDIALLDSGVAPVSGLSDAGKVVNGPDLTPESQSSATRYLDTYGHGTHMAGIIAGRDTGVNPVASFGSSAPFLGVAPGARIISVKVADAHGSTDVSQVIAGIDWVVQHAHDPGMNIRVLNLSYGTDSAQSFRYDPLAYAAEVAWRNGIVVVNAAGNSGLTNGRLADPAMNPNLLAVGADDLKGTSATSDDVVPTWSSRGDGVRNPDLVSPGLSLQSLRVPGSYIDATYGSTGQVSDRFFRGSGTSQAAAFTTGEVALLLQMRPSSTPEQLKYMLAAMSIKLLGGDATAQGRGLLKLGSVTSILGLIGAVPLPTTAATGTGTLEGSRGSNHLVLDGVTLTGEIDIFGKAFNAGPMATAEASRTSWTGGTWNGSVWAGGSWTASGWAADSWTGRTWAGGAWTGRTWATGTWNGRTWASTNWVGSDWHGFGWSGRTWAGANWGTASEK